MSIEVDDETSESDYFEMDSPFHSTFDIIEPKKISIPNSPNPVNNTSSSQITPIIPEVMLHPNAVRASEFAKAYFKLTDDPEK